MAGGRRRALQVAAALCTGAGLAPVAALVGCASRPPAPPPPPPRPFDAVLLLPVALPLREDERGLSDGSARRAPAIPASTFSAGPGGGGISPAAGAAALGVTFLVAAALSARREAQRKEEQEIRDAFAAVDLDVAAYLDARLAGALEQRGLRVRRVVAPEAVTALRAGKRVDGPDGDPGAAVVAVHVNGSGYYASGRAGGYSPLLDVWALLHGPEGDAAPADEFGYYSDWRDGGKENRWITSPKAITLASPAAIREQAAAVRLGLTELLDRMVELIAADVARRAQGQPALP